MENIATFFHDRSNISEFRSAKKGENIFKMEVLNNGKKNSTAQNNRKQVIISTYFITTLM